LALGEGEAERKGDDVFDHKQLTLGCRICPGRHLAHLSLWIVLATILSTLQISKVKDENGQEIIPEIGFEVNVTMYVLTPFHMNELIR